MQHIVDTHLHIWDLEKFSLPWLDGVPALAHTVTEADYLAECGEGPGWKLDAAIYVEVDVAADQKLAEVAYVSARCALRESPILAAIASLDLGDRESAAMLAEMAANPAIRGIRHVLHVPESPKGACLAPAFVANVQRMGELGLLFEACLRCEELDDLVELAKLCPDTTIILDHMGIVDAPVIAKADPDQKERLYRDRWLANIAALGHLPNVACKISGIDAPRQGAMASLRPALEACFSAFGEDRILFATNYPVSQLGLGAREWIAILLGIVTGKSETFRNKLFCENALKYYRISNH
ncbi:amidohydrolase family protein [uncultured Cohaesibacter sp.]|uniref:amidohydrolase family protein n=1 Tax=uncultured Cohaesibacter sp. TaxID=1002546 RepID=UPI0029C86859|nr:amidohydrolase family protein [uncultured Cohaesibacter sp.]